jgi:hypothetical protein
MGSGSSSKKGNPKVDMEGWLKVELKSKIRALRGRIVPDTFALPVIYETRNH